MCTSSFRARVGTTDPLPPGQRRDHGGPGHVRQARLAARALAARDQRDRLALPAHVVQPALRRVGFVGAPFYLLTEVLSPVIEVLALVTLAVASPSGSSIPGLRRRAGAVAFVNASLTAVRDPARRPPVATVPRAGPRPAAGPRAARPRALPAFHHLGAPEGSGGSCAATRPGTGSSGTCARRPDRSSPRSGERGQHVVRVLGGLHRAHDLRDVPVGVDDERRALHAHVLLAGKLFSTQVPYLSATSCASSERSVNGSPYFSRNFTCFLGCPGSRRGRPRPCARTRPTRRGSRRPAPCSRACRPVG